MNRKRIGTTVCLFFLLMSGCSSTTGSSNRNPAENPNSIVPGVVRSIGQEGAADGQFTLPESIVQDAQGNIYVADSFNDRIEKFDPDGNYILSWGSSGAEDGQFQGCRGLAIDSANNVYVTDVILHRVQKFDSSGNFITKWGSEGTGIGEFSAPFDISADSLNNLYVVDANNNRIQKFDSSGRHLGQFGTRGTGDGQFDEPIGITIDYRNNIYIADGRDNRIQKFDQNMRFVAKWRGAGTGDGQFVTPYGLAADRDGNIYVTDLGNNRIQKFDSSGNYLGKAAQAGYQEGELFEPSDVIVDQFGNLYVVDGNNHRVQIFTQVIFTVSAAARQAAVSASAPSTAARPTASWMKDIAASGALGSKPLTTLLIPGTHDTGTYNITVSSDMADDGNFNGEKAVTDITGKTTEWCDKESWCKYSVGKLLHTLVDPINKTAVGIAKSIQAPWSKSQDETVLQQLQGGVRFLDLRVQALGKNNFAIVHSMVSVAINDILDDIVTFCNDPASSREIILLSITKKYKMDGHEDELANLIKTKLGSLLIDRTDPSTVTLNSIWTGPGRVIVFYPDAETVEKYPYLWLKNAGDDNKVETQTTADHTTFVSTLVNTWPKTKDSDYLSRITRGNRGSFLTAHPNDYSKYFYVSQLIRTQEEEAIIIGIESDVFSLFIKDLNKVERYYFKKLWKKLGFHSPPIIGPTNLLDWGSDTNDDVMGDFFQHADPLLKWNILMVDNYKKGPVDFVQQIISYNLQL
ncbi:MAG: 6-bladed beta-propeller [Syntrophales bacterium]|nr:6-bladed beta-propeller [Syntrophales bacterium]